MITLSKLLKVCSFSFLLSFSVHAAEPRSCFYDSVLGRFMVMNDNGQWESFSVKDEARMPKLECNGAMALFYDGENLVFWDALQGFSWSSAAELNSTYVKIAVASEVAAFYDGYSLFVKTLAGPLLQEKGVWQRKTNANLVAYKDTASFYDGGDWFVARAGKIFQYTKLFTHASFVTQSIGPHGVLLYDGINLHSFCQGEFSRWGDSPLQGRARVNAGGLMINESYFYLNPNCQLKKVSSALDLPLSR